MIKIIGFLIIFLSSSKIGYDIGERYKNRTEELKSLAMALEIIKNEISFSNCVIADAIKGGAGVSCKKISRMLTEMSDMVKDGDKSVFEAYKSVLPKLELSLNKNDMQILENLFSVFGGGDKIAEAQNIDKATDKIYRNIKSAFADEKKYVKLFRTFGVLSGVLIGIIFI